MSISGNLKNNFYLKKYELGEIARSAYDFQYFIENYFLTSHPTNRSGFLQLYPYQQNIINSFSSNEHSIWLLSRQIGFSTLTYAYALWKSIFNPGMVTLLLTYNQSMAREVIKTIDFATKGVPDYLISSSITNSNSISLDNSSKIIVNDYRESVGKGMSINLLILEDAAHVKSDKVKNVMQSLLPCVLPKGQVIVGSTPSTTDHYFYDMWKMANRSANNMVPHTIKWDQVPLRDNSFKTTQMSNLGYAKFESEFNCQFVDLV